MGKVDGSRGVSAILTILPMSNGILRALLLPMQAFVLFEESIPDSGAERVALASITGALHRCCIFPVEPRATLVHKATGYSAKLLRKADQCRAVLACSHLYWQVTAMLYPHVLSGRFCSYTSCMHGHHHQPCSRALLDQIFFS